METEDEDFPPLIKDIGDKYIVEKVLSYQTGEAYIYLVKKKLNDDKTYVAKISKYIESENLENEISKIKQLEKKKCPYIIKYIDDGIITLKTDYEELEIKYLILEYASNYDLGDYLMITKTGFGELYTKVIFYKILTGIQEIHKSKICHRDIKPDNIIFGENFIPKITDFGHCIKCTSKVKGNAGTRAYKAPELIKGEGVVPYDGIKADIYSLGITLIELVIGIYAFLNKKEYYKLYKYIIDGNKNEFWSELLKESNGKYSSEFKDLCWKMIDLDPKKRPEIGDILKDKWFGEIRNMNAEQLGNYEKAINLENVLLEKSKKVQAKKKKFLNIINTIVGYIPTVKSLEENSNFYFTDEINPKEIKSGRFMNYIINIKGSINLKDFMNFLLFEFDKEFGKICHIEKDEENAKIKIDFEDIDNNIYTIGIKLYKTDEGHLLRFIKKGGTKKDFFDIYERIVDLIKAS